MKKRVRIPRTAAGDTVRSWWENIKREGASEGSPPILFVGKKAIYAEGFFQNVAVAVDLSAYRALREKEGA